MANILMIPASGAIIFDSQSAGSSGISSLTGAPRLLYDNAGGLNITSYTTGSGTFDRFTVDGTYGRLFSVADSVTGTIFSVNDAAGLPVIEVESNLTDKITMGTYGSNALVVDDVRVGIGTGTPSGKLHIVDATLAGTGFLSGSALNIQQTWNTSGAPTAIKLNVFDIASTGTSNLMDLQVSGASKFKVNKNGNVTLGAVDAIAGGLLLNSTSVGGATIYGNTRIQAGALNFNGTTYLHSDGNDIIAQRNGSAPQESRIYGTYTNATNFERLNLKYNSTDSAFQIGTEKGSSGNARPLQLQTDNVTRMTLSTGGNVGIGTTTPDTKLYVVGKLAVNNSALGSKALDVYTAEAGTAAIIQSNGLTNGDTIMSLAGAASSGVAYALRGSVQSNSAGIITIQQNGVGDAVLEALSISVGDSMSRYLINGGASYSIGIDNSDSDKFKISNSSVLGTNDRLVINDSGYVGIGTTAPAEKLDVAGNVKISGSLSTNTLGVSGASVFNSSAAFAIRPTVSGTGVLLSGELETGSFLTTGVGDSRYAFSNATGSFLTATTANALYVELTDLPVFQTGNQIISGLKTFASALNLTTQATTTGQAVRADRSISAGAGLAGGGDLTANRTLSVDTSAVVMTSGPQTISGAKTFTAGLTSSIEYTSVVPIFGQRANKINELVDVLYQADKRFTVTNGSPVLFDGNFDGGFGLTQNATTIITINVAGKSGVPANGFTYPQGEIYVSFYYTNNNYSALSLRTQNNGVWYTAAAPVDVSNAAGLKVMKFSVPGSNYLTDIELTITTDAVNFVQLAAINYIPSRWTTEMELPFVSKYLNSNTLFGDLNVTNNNQSANNKLAGNGSSFLASTIGNVGVGTSTPDSKLHIKSVMGAKGQLQIQDTSATGVASSHLLSFYDNSGARQAYIYKEATSAKFGLFNEQNGASVITTIDDVLNVVGAGNVGIGTATPTAKLHIEGNSNPTILVKTTSTAGYSQMLFGNTVANGDGFWLNGSAQAGYGGTNSLNAYVSNGVLAFHTASVTNAFNLLQNGRVGIGTTTPSARLHIAGGDTSLAFTGASLALGFGATATYPHFIHTRHNAGTPVSNAIDFYTSNGTEAGVYPSHAIHALTLTNSNVGIGTTAPNAKLSIVETSLAVGAGQTGSALDIQQTWSSNGSPTAIKLNVTNTNSAAASKLMDLQVSGVSKFKVDKFGAIIFDSEITTDWVGAGVRIGNRYGSPTLQNATALLNLSNGGVVNIGGTIPSYTIAGDTSLARDGGGIFAQRNGINPQTYRIYNTYTSDTNFERLNFRWDSSVAKIGTSQGASSGVARDLVLETSGTERVRITASGLFSADGISFGKGREGIASNIAIGQSSLVKNISGNDNLAIGQNTLSENTNGAFNVAVGKDSLKYNTDGSYNIAIGQNALISEQGSYTVAIGQNTLSNSSNGNYNVVMGHESLGSAIDSSSNVVIGYHAGLYDVAAASVDYLYNSVCIGTEASFYGPYGDNNSIAIGYSARGMGDNSAVFGNDSIANTYLKGIVQIPRLAANPFDSERIAMRWNDLTGTIGTSTVGTGLARDLVLETSGTERVRITADGQFSANGIPFGRGGGNSIDNIAIGPASLNGNTAGTNNIAIGTEALTNANGSNNVIIGNLAGKITSSSGDDLTVDGLVNSVLIGYESTCRTVNSDNNAIVIGYQAQGMGTNSTVLGNDSITNTYLKGIVQIHRQSTVNPIIYERIAMRWNGLVGTIGTSQTGAGTFARALALETNGTARMIIATGGNVSNSALFSTSGFAYTGIAPATTGAPGVSGEMAFSANFLYRHNGTNWQRTGIGFANW